MKKTKKEEKVGFEIEICPQCGIVYDPKINGFCPLCLVLDHRLLMKMVGEKTKNNFEVICDKTNNSQKDFEREEK